MGTHFTKKKYTLNKFTKFKKQGKLTKVNKTFWVSVHQSVKLPMDMG